MESSRTRRVRKRRIPKACGTCRRAKAKCDGKRPCTRCQGLGKVCTFADRPKEAHELRIEELERELEVLRARLGEPASAATTSATATATATATNNAAFSSSYQPDLSSNAASSLTLADHASAVLGPPYEPQSESSATPSRSRGAKKSSFDAGSVSLTDCIDASLVTMSQAEEYFAVFFQGCDHYVPVFDPCHDSFASIRERSSLLFTAICTVGCRIAVGTDTQQWRMLEFHLKRMLNYALAKSSLACLETVQAFLVRSCYAPERSLLTAAATRMAVDLGFPDSYDELISQSIGFGGRGESEAVLLRRTRTWLHLLVLGHIHHVDAADLPTFKFVGQARRSRVILKSHFSTELDLFLFSQVELNVIRTRSYDSLFNLAVSDDGHLMETVREARIDLDVWFDDWSRIFERHGQQSPWLLVNLRAQKCWAENMAMCRAVRASGVENVDFMSSAQREILCMARDALEEHLHIVLEQPRLYLRNLRFAMDFVWAKCTFCYLLLIKLSILVPDRGRGRSSQELIQDGNALLAELEAGDGCSLGDRSNTSKLYIQLLRVGIQRFSNSLKGGDGDDAARMDDPNTAGRRSTPSPLATTAESQDGLDYFVPEQFVFEWDFPGLTLFSSATGVSWLDDILLGALPGGGADLFGWGAMETCE